MRRSLLATILAGCSAALVAFAVPQGAQSRPAPQRLATVVFAVPAKLAPSEPPHRLVPPTLAPVVVPVAAPKATVAIRRPVALAAPQRAVRAVRRAPVVHHAAPVIYRAATGTMACIVMHESGGNPTAVNAQTGDASGLVGFLDSTWHGVTGLPGKASQYSPATQMAAAWKLEAASGWSPWRGDGCVG